MGTFKYIGLPALEAKAVAAVTTAVNQSANHLVAAAEPYTPIDEGTLLGDIHTDGARVSGFTVTARVGTGGASSDYAIVQHEGAGPHVIRPRNGKALAFNGIVVKSVNHPGNPATKFLERPLLENRSKYVALMAAAARRQF